MSQRPLLVTTSWDDGHALDLRMATLLSEFGLKATFYVTFNYPGRPEITPAQIRELAALGMEIGSHTLSHRLLVQVPRDEIFRELDESKRRLEDVLGTPVLAISYPLGYTNRSVFEAWHKAGYRLGRTTQAFRWSCAFDPARMPMTVEFNRATRSSLARHAARDCNLLGMWRWLRKTGLATDPAQLARQLFACVAERGGIFHLIGRSPDIEAGGLWDDLKALLRQLHDSPGAQFLTNSQVLKAVQGTAFAPGGEPGLPART